MLFWQAISRGGSVTGRQVPPCAHATPHGASHAAAQPLTLRAGMPGRLQCKCCSLVKLNHMWQILLCAAPCCPAQAFKGIWRMLPAGPEAASTVLQYSLFVRPHPWLPVKLIEDRISSEVVNNLNAVRRHTERVHKQRQQQQGALSSIDGGMTERSSTALSRSSATTTLGTDALTSEE